MQLLSFCDSSLVHSCFTAASGLLTTPLPEWLPGNREDAFMALLMTPEFYFFFPDKFQIHPLPLSFIEMGKLADPCRMMSKDELRGALLSQPAKHVEHFRKQH